MSWKRIPFALFITATAVPVSASQSEHTDHPAIAGAPQASEGALYCLKMEPITGTRIGSILCWTRQQWAENDIDLDKAWAEDGVEVIGG